MKKTPDERGSIDQMVEAGAMAVVFLEDPTDKRGAVIGVRMPPHDAETVVPAHIYIGAVMASLLQADNADLFDQAEARLINGAREVRHGYAH